jgi:16S rRNA (guanine966-N2)-methyltransferase
VTRIISGFAGSLTLKVPSEGTRPTSDRVREAIFSSLEARDAIEGARVLDLFAGSGALGLEAASRGAVTLTLVEKSYAAAQVCRANAAIVSARAPSGQEPDIRVVSTAVQTFLTSALETWNLVFADPPYELSGRELDHILTALVPRLAPDALVVLERSTRSPLPAWPIELALDKTSRYGDTVIYWLRGKEAS